MRAVLLPLLLLAACSREDVGGADEAPPAAAAEARPADAEAAPAAATTAAAKGEMRSFGNWEAACDNVGTCVLFGFPPGRVEDEDHWARFVRLERAAGGAAEPVLMLAAGGWSGEEQQETGVIEARVDGGRVFTTPARANEVGPYYAGELRGPEARALIAAFRNGETLRIEVRGFGSSTVSLDGAAAALLWMDDKQGRVGTTTALMRPGDRPASAVPPAGALPVVRAVRTGGVTREVSADQLRDPEAANCKEDVPDGFIEQTASADHLGGAVWLWSVPCGGGAYNSATAFFLGDRNGRGLRPAFLRGADTAMTETPRHHAWNAVFDPQTGLLESVMKARGIGDCGGEEVWAWTGRGFATVRERAMGRCEGVTIDLWPALYRAEVR